MRFSLAAIAFTATAVYAQKTTAPATSYPVSTASFAVSGAPSGTGAAPSHIPSFVNGAPSNNFKIGAVALAAVAAIVL